MMTEYVVLWLSVFVFLAIGMLTNIVFFRRVRMNKKMGGRKSLDSMLFVVNGK
jgi:hypothetical protein